MRCLLKTLDHPCFNQVVLLIWDFKSSACGYMCFPGGASGKEPTCQCRRRERPRFHPWVGKRAWPPSPVFLPGESHGQRSQAGYCPKGRKELDMTEGLSTHTLHCPQPPWPLSFTKDCCIRLYKNLVIHSPLSPHPERSSGQRSGILCALEKLAEQAFT